MSFSCQSNIVTPLELGPAEPSLCVPPPARPPAHPCPMRADQDTLALLTEKTRQAQAAQAAAAAGQEQVNRLLLEQVSGVFWRRPA